MDERIKAAADELKEAIALKLGELADRLLERPEFGTPEWVDWWGNKDTPAGNARRREWHLVKLQISREAGVDQTGNAINARHCGASWEEIGQACGITRQAAHDRWAKFEDLFETNHNTDTEN